MLALFHIILLWKVRFIHMNILCCSFENCFLSRFFALENMEGERGNMYSGCHCSVGLQPDRYRIVTGKDVV